MNISDVFDKNIRQIFSDLLGEEPTIENLVQWLTEDLKSRSFLPTERKLLE